MKSDIKFAIIFGNGSCQTKTVPELHRRWREVLANECVRNGIPFSAEKRTIVEDLVEEM